MDPILDAIPTIRVVIGEMERDKHRARIAFETLLATLREIGPTQFTHKQFEFGINNLLVSWKP